MANTDTYGKNVGGNYARFFGLGFALILIVAVPTVIGLFVDRLVGTLPLFLLLGLGLGFAGALYNVYQAVKKIDDR